MRRKLAALGLVLAAVLAWNHFRTHAQSGQLFYMAPASGTTTTNCGTPASGTFPLCGVATGWYVWNGSAWVQLGTATAAGVTSAQVCNAAGSSCATAQTGAVVLDIPKTVTVTVPSEAATVTVN